MRTTLLAIGAIALSSCTAAQPVATNSNEPAYSFHLNLSEFQEDRLSVTLTLPGWNQPTATFCFPKIVPGIYGDMDFGQYVSALEAADKVGKPLAARQIDENCWEISNARALHTLTYRVDDAWEAFDFNLKEGFYRSAASSFSPESFVINTNCLFGYLEGFEDMPIQVSVAKPEELYAATSLNRDKERSAAGRDVFSAQDYHQLVDNPILYAPPDTTMIHLPGINVEVACHSTSGKPISGEVAQYIRPLLESQAEYLGGKLPVDKYSFLLYHNLNTEEYGYIGDGLEHARSTLILLYMPLDMDAIRETVYGIASHEFFHILMPLGLHSREIADYDFNNPKFSRHLWLYEGMTEYFTMHMPVKTGLQSPEEFIEEVERKIAAMKEFDNSIPLTELSIKAREMQDQYYNFYLKGALVNLCLDIRLRELSGGNYGVQNLVLGLIEKYGPGRPFEDEKLFDEIVAITGYSEIGEFTDKYIAGGEPLPLQETLQKAGLDLDVDTGKITKVAEMTEAQKKLRRYWIGQ
ncbi:MAG: peptidase M61 [Phaeodactylibacter sp.]|nr:peptidase M61 [Phaeodactylibacter sp.]